MRIDFTLGPLHIYPSNRVSVKNEVGLEAVTIYAQMARLLDLIEKAEIRTLYRRKYPLLDGGMEMEAS